MTTRRVIRFKFAADKALAAIHWMVCQSQPLDLHTMLKTCYFADKALLNSEGRPIFGATYRAMKFGPVPLEIYEMAKGEPLWLAELGLPQFPWQLKGYRLSLDSNCQPDTGALSEQDLAALEDALAYAKSLSFNGRTAATHGADWQAADLGVMRYEDMLDETPGRAGQIAELSEMAPFMRL
ncbi:Panacea domain-containing protein [Acidisoma silvae]|uniref:SocA family protein n=1 Tax=Acidisoma silvae TaxID=2802396 RepID=A0A963YUN7_9PROT|nr:Panacea domain-containing protein [Acidisoma silvae]MCB8877339.1 SocA family protein [Acidisoma silvae]